jgi:uncharacterized protein (DUF952 family)
VADFNFRGRSGLVLLEIDRSALPCDVIDENLDGGSELFPHIYGRLPMSAVRETYNFPCRSDGRFELPSDVPDSVQEPTARSLRWPAAAQRPKR